MVYVIKVGMGAGGESRYLAGWFSEPGLPRELDGIPAIIEKLLPADGQFAFKLTQTKKAIAAGIGNKIPLVKGRTQVVDFRRQQ